MKPLTAEERTGLFDDLSKILDSLSGWTVTLDYAPTHQKIKDALEIINRRKNRLDRVAGRLEIDADLVPKSVPFTQEEDELIDIAYDFSANLEFMRKDLDKIITEALNRFRGLEEGRKKGPKTIKEKTNAKHQEVYDAYDRLVDAGWGEKRIKKELIDVFGKGKETKIGFIQYSRSRFYEILNLR